MSLNTRSGRANSVKELRRLETVCPTQNLKKSLPRFRLAVFAELEAKQSPPPHGQKDSHPRTMSEAFDRARLCEEV